MDIPGFLSKVARVAVIAAILNTLVFDARIILSPDTLQVQYTPDDAYYYLGLARNFAGSGVWSFDSGVSVTSGFHLLFPYLLVLLHIITSPGTEQFVTIALLLSALLTLTTAGVMTWRGYRRGHTLYLLILALFISSRNFVHNSVSVVEWPLVILFAFIYWDLLDDNQREARFADHVFIFLAGLGGSLARSDFGLFPLSMFLVSAIFWIPRRNSKALGHSFIGLVGAGMGVIVVMVHGYLTAGSLLQSSALMKSHWSGFEPSTLQYVLPLPFSLLGANILRYWEVTLIAVLLFLFVIPYFLWRQDVKMWEKGVLSQFVKAVSSLSGFRSVVGSSLCILGYLVFYSYGEIPQPWYTANFFVPFFVLIVTVAENVEQVLTVRFREYFLIIVGFLVVGLSVRNVVANHDLSPSASTWPHQEAMIEAGRFLAQNNFSERVGSWNAGIIGYYQGGTLINIDGLVNQDIYPYAVSNTLPQYLSQQKITYIVDFENMVAEEKYRVRGGYNDNDFFERLTPLRVFSDDRFHWKRLTLFELSSARPVPVVP